MPYDEWGKGYQAQPNLSVNLKRIWWWSLTYLWKMCSSFISPCTACPSLVDVVVVCDESNSIYPWEAVKNFLEKFVQGLDIGPKKTQVRTSKIINEHVALLWGK